MLEEQIQKVKCRIGMLKKMISIRKKNMEVLPKEIEDCNDELELQESLLLINKRHEALRPPTKIDRH